MKAETIIYDALMEIGQQAAENDVSAPDMATGIRYINRLMYGVAYLGLGFTVITSASQEVTIPDYALEWVVLGLAGRLIPQYPSVADSDKISIEKNTRVAWRNLLIQHQELPTTKLPSTLPIGSGNERYYTPRFYPTSNDELLQEDGDNILLEANNDL